MPDWGTLVNKTQALSRGVSGFGAAQPQEWGEPSLAELPQLRQEHLCPRTPRGHLAEATAGASGNAPSGKGKKGKARGKAFGKKQKLKKPEPDILSPAAMLNLYYIAHNVADCLYLRGYPWPGAPKGKKGKNRI